MKYLVLLLILVVSSSGADVSGKVVKIADGDTLTILTFDKKQIKVRLSEIDAPERKQAFGNKSRQALINLCAGSRAILKNTSKDRYKRTLATVYCDGVDANTEMVKIGMAWVYDRYAKDKTLYELQAYAQLEKLGLWADPSPTPPWEFRRK
jgi:endonuclease YncB( thermonuclease family)